MKDADRRQRNTQRLSEMYGPMAAVVRRVLDRVESRGLRPRIQEAWRSEAAQLTAFNEGHSKVRFGFHNVTGANDAEESLACDVLDDDNAVNPGPRYLLALAIAAHDEGLTTGIRWGLTPGLVAGVDAAVAARDIDRPVKVGWDPTHVEPVGITITQARAGKRPAFAAAPSAAQLLGGIETFHVVRRGETLGRIAKDAHLSTLQILALNPNKQANPNLIVVGEKIRIA